MEKSMKVRIKKNFNFLFSEINLNFFLYKFQVSVGMISQLAKFEAFCLKFKDCIGYKNF